MCHVWELCGRRSSFSFGKYISSEMLYMCQMQVIYWNIPTSESWICVYWIIVLHNPNIFLMDDLFHTTFKCWNWKSSTQVIFPLICLLITLMLHSAMLPKFFYNSCLFSCAILANTIQFLQCFFNHWSNVSSVQTDMGTSEIDIYI